MRLTWLVLGVVAAAGAVAFINTEDEGTKLPAAAAAPGEGTAKTALQRGAPAGGGAPAPAGAQSKEEQKAELQAQARLDALARARAEGNASKEDTLAKRLRQEAWDAPSSRRWAYTEGRALLEEVGARQDAKAIAVKDRARRLLSRVLYLPEMFQASGSSTDERTALLQTLDKINRQVMRYGPGIEGVTVPYEVPPGITPVQIISRQKLPMGSNGILYWNQGGNLDPKRLRAGQILLLPQEPLSVQVHLRLRRMALFMGDWFVKEFRVGIGKEETPSPLGTFTVHSREKNPDWWPSGGKRVPFGDPKNELGSAWIALESQMYPLSSGYGIHGTNKPNTVGTRCSNGCVRLVNDQATEMYDWVRTGSNGGQATQVHIR
jgi:hypothetical protein